MTVHRLEPWEAKDGFGHYWIEVDGKAYGWWPNPSASKDQWFDRSVPGVLADGNDPYFGTRSKVTSYNVFVDGTKNAAIQTNTFIVDKIRNIASGYGNYGRGCDCRTLQKDVIKSLDWELKKAP